MKMKSKILIALCALSLTVSVAFPGQIFAESTSATEQVQRQLLIQLIQRLQSMIAELQAALAKQNSTTKSDSSDDDDEDEDKDDDEDEDELQNLSISEITLSLPGGIGHTSSTEVPVPNQKVTVEVKNNAHGSYNLSGKKFNYEAYLYEIKDSGGRTKTDIWAAGEALIPYANGYSSFDFYIEGGLPFNDDFERTFQIRVYIDTDDDVEEENESDNKKWSDEWLVDYYKG